MPGRSPSSPRGNQTREALVVAATEIFGRDGFHAASTRSIADAASVNQALIGYHFGGKPGLYVAVFDRIIRHAEQRLGPVAHAIEQQIDAMASGVDSRQSERCLGFVHVLTDAFVATFAAPESTAWARVILREQQDPSDAFDRLYTGVMQRLLALLARLIALVRGTDPRSAETRLLCQTIIGQALVFRSARATVLRQLDWPQIGAAEITAIQAVIRRNVTAMLQGGNNR